MTLFLDRIMAPVDRFIDGITMYRLTLYVYLFKITGAGGGEWTVDTVAKPPTCTPGDKGNAQCTVTVSHDDFKTMLGDPNAGMQLYFQGKLQVAGDPMLAMKLQQLFELARPK